jgi:hypothetical protein
MKTLPCLLRCAAITAILVTTALPAFSQITVKVDSTKTWNGWMNVYDINNTYLYGQGWGTDALRAAFVPTPATATRLVLGVNTNSYNPDGFWNLPDGTPNKNLEANFYVEVAGAFGGNEVTFTGTVASNTIPAGWTCVAVIKEFAPGYAYLGDTRSPLVGGEVFAVTRPIGAGNIVQYGFLIYGPNAAPGSADAATGIGVLVDNADPSITSEPVNQRTVIGGSASFTVAAQSSSALSYQWKRYGTNLANGGRFSGATSATLNIANAQLDDATTYTVTVTSTAGSLDSQPARLRVLTPLEFANLLDNPSFELDVVAPYQVPAPWNNFSGSELVSTNDDYGYFPLNPITPHQGTNAVRVFNAGEWNGFFQDVPAAPGEVFTADGWFQLHPYDLLQGNCVANLEIQFRAGGTPLAMWISSPITNDPPSDAWYFYQATNGVPAGFTQITTTNAHYLVAPPGTDRVRYQLTLHNLGGALGTVYADSLRFMKKTPVELTISTVGGGVQLAWPTQFGSTYQVTYSDSLGSPSWQTLGAPVVGDGTIKTVTYPTAGQGRYYRVLTL